MASTAVEAPVGAPPTAAPPATVLRLTPAAQTYAWGALPATSLVARLAACNGGRGAPLGASTPHAELWMGTHPTAPARLAADGRPLTAFLDEQGLPGLPFLLKVLSVRTALSIQAHPTKELAAELHASNPDAYKDDNHKPEMAVAVTPFSAMCCFRRVAEIVTDCDRLPALVGAFGEDGRGLVDRLRGVAGEPVGGGTPAGEGDDAADAASADALRVAFDALMNQEPAAVASSLSTLLDAVRALPEGDRTPADELLLTLASQYPDDVGCFAAYLLNRVTLAPGEALFLPANEPHAYLSGDCVEVMATSDNVVRAGLTPKFKDVPVLVKMLTYAAGPPLPPVIARLNRNVVRYTPPVKEFMLERVEVAADERETVRLPALPGGSVMVVLAGDAWLRLAGGKELWPLFGGAVYYLGPSAEVDVVPSGRGGGGGDGQLPATPLLAYRAAENSDTS